MSSSETESKNEPNMKTRQYRTEIYSMLHYVENIYFFTIGKPQTNTIIKLFTGVLNASSVNRHVVYS